MIISTLSEYYRDLKLLCSLSALCLAVQGCGKPERETAAIEADWFQFSELAGAESTAGVSYEIWREQLNRVEPPPVELVRISPDLMLQVDLKKQEPPIDLSNHVLKIGADFYGDKFHAPPSWKLSTPDEQTVRPSDPFGFDSGPAITPDHNPFKNQGEHVYRSEEGFVPGKYSYQWEVRINSMEEGRKALQAIRKLHQLPDYRVIDPPDLSGLSVSDAKFQGSGWFQPNRLFLHLPYREKTLSEDGVLTSRSYPWQPFSMPLNAARLRVDTERSDKWWVEMNITTLFYEGEWVMGHFAEYFDLVIKGNPVGSGITVGGTSGYTNDFKDCNTMVISVVDLEEGRAILEELRDIHSDLPKDAIIDVTKGEIHGPIHVYRSAHLRKNKPHWVEVGNQIRIVDFDRGIEGYSLNTTGQKAWLDVLNALEVISKRTDPLQAGVAFYLPQQFWERFLETTGPESLANLSVSDGTTLMDTIHSVLPTGWVCYPVAERRIAIIPKDAIQTENPRGDSPTEGNRTHPQN